MLDIDTGGGEMLAALAPLACFVVATEGYAPNVGVAAERLASAGIPLVHAGSAPDNVEQSGSTPLETSSALPFRDEAFELVVDRHSSYWPSEVRRVLAEGGRFLTQQRNEAGTAGASWEELFGRTRTPEQRFDLAFARRQLAQADFEVVRAEEADTPIAFNDVGAVVYYLRAIPWAVQGFDPAGDRVVLERIHERIRRDGRLVVRGSCMLLEAIAR
jgi:SAM-dependent methyltransferase